MKHISSFLPKNTITEAPFDTKLREFSNAFIFTDENKYLGEEYNDIRKNIYILAGNDKISPKTHDFLLDIVYEIKDELTHDIAYEVVAKACDIIMENVSKKET